MLTLETLDPKVKEEIQSITELSNTKVYLLELSSHLPEFIFCELAKKLKECFEQAGITCIVTRERLIENIYELKGGDEDDSGTSSK